MVYALVGIPFTLIFLSALVQVQHLAIINVHHCKSSSTNHLHHPEHPPLLLVNIGLLTNTNNVTLLNIMFTKHGLLC